MSKLYQNNEKSSNEIIRPSGISFSFDLALAKAYGIKQALVIKNFQHWITVNKKNNRNFIEGRYWTYQTKEEISDHIQCLTFEEVRYAIECLIEIGILIKGNFNKAKFDHTIWYAFANEEIFIPNIEHSSNNSYESGKPPIDKGADHYRTVDNRLSSADIRCAIPDTKSTHTKKRDNIAISEAKPPEITDKISFSWKNHQFEKISQDIIESWKKSFPSVDIIQQINQSQEYIKSRPTTYKRRKNWNKFLVDWFSRNQEKANSPASYPQKKSSYASYSRQSELDKMAEEILERNKE